MFDKINDEGLLELTISNVEEPFLNEDNKQKLKTLIISNNVEIINTNIFSECTNLKHIIIKKRENKKIFIDNEAFLNCYNLNNIEIKEDDKKNGLIEIHNCAFNYCPNILPKTKLEITQNNVSYLSENWFNKYKKKSFQHFKYF